MTVSPFDHPLLSALVGEEQVTQQFSLQAEIAAMLSVEAALAEAEADNGIMPPEAAATIVSKLSTFRPDTARLRAGMEIDGVAVPELVRQFRAAVDAPHGEMVHFGATSQDVIDTALVLRLKPVLEHLDTRLATVAEKLAELDRRFGDHTLTGMTRMQPALPIRVSDRIAAWRRPLERHRDRLAVLSPRLLVVQFGGAVGTLDRLGGKAAAVRKALAEKLGLGNAPQWHAQRDTLADFAGLLSLMTGSLGKFGQDVALMAAMGEIALAGGGGSSAMPHKKNPVKAEALVALARFNAVQLSGMQQALIHEQERSGAAWMLEWLILPQMVVAAASALRLADALTGQVESLGS